MTNPVCRRLSFRARHRKLVRLFRKQCDQIWCVVTEQEYQNRIRKVPNLVTTRTDAQTLPQSDQELEDEMPGLPAIFPIVTR